MKEEVLSEARYLWESCFPDDDVAFLDFYFSRVARNEDTYVDYDRAGKPIAHIGVLRYRYGASPDLSLAYISGACTHPDYRQQGCMERLMQRVVSQERARGTDALILIPADDNLRRYYAKHFGFIDTAPCCRLPWDLYQELRLYDYECVVRGATSAAKLLEEAYLGSKHIIYTQTQAEAIIDEYRSLGGYVAERWDGDCCRALMLARVNEAMICVDAFVGTYQDTLSIVAELPKSKKLEWHYLFLQPEVLKSLPSEVNQYCSPWGMALPLSNLALGVVWSNLGISLVHN